MGAGLSMAGVGPAAGTARAIGWGVGLAAGVRVGTRAPVGLGLSIAGVIPAPAEAGAVGRVGLAVGTMASGIAVADGSGVGVAADARVATGEAVGAGLSATDVCPMDAPHPTKTSRLIRGTTEDKLRKSGAL